MNFPKNLFSKRQIEIIRLVSEEKQNKEIANFLNVSPKTIEFEKSRIYEYTGTKSSLGLFKWALKQNFFEIKY
jgi:DNA-binding CsgD family transcriptional regulator